MKKLLLFITVLSSSFYALAQDTLTNKKGEEIQVKVLEITPDLIKYKRFDNLEGPVISVQKQEVAEIKYENGSFEKFDLAPKLAKTEIQRPAILRKNALAVNVLPILFQSFNVFYDHLLNSKPNIGLSFGFGAFNHAEDFFSAPSNQISLTGAAKFYIQQSDFYVSPYLKYRHISYRASTNWDQFGGGATIGSRHVFKSGFLIDSFMGLGGYGIQQSNRTQEDEYYYVPGTIDIRLGVALGFAF